MEEIDHETNKEECYNETLLIYCQKNIRKELLQNYQHLFAHDERFSVLADGITDFPHSGERPTRL
jgi:hypothetical protein